MGWDWTWLFRRRCGAIATAVSDGNEIRVTLCQRRRWHQGECRGDGVRGKRHPTDCSCSPCALDALTREGERLGWYWGTEQ